MTLPRPKPPKAVKSLRGSATKAPGAAGGTASSERLRLVSRTRPTATRRVSGLCRQAWPGMRGAARCVLSAVYV